MNATSPSAEWYEPADLIENDDEPDPLPDAAEMLVIFNGVVIWTAAA